MARYKIECCRNCPNRKGGCHSTCVDYKTQKAEYDATMEEIRKKHNVEDGLRKQTIGSIERMYKRTRMKGR
jgi:hypothetical protein